MNHNPLFCPLRLGQLHLSNRIVMPPMTRSRASQPGDVANAMMATYYAQRAGAGLIIGEGTQIRSHGQGLCVDAGHPQRRAGGWLEAGDRCGARQGGRRVAQLWHVGRVTHPDNIGGAQPISSSAIKAEGVKVFVDNGSDAPALWRRSLPAP